MSFWIWVGVGLVLVLVVAFVSDRRRRGGRHGYRDAEGQHRTDRQRETGDRNSGEGYGGGGI